MTMTLLLAPVDRDEDLIERVQGVATIPGDQYSPERASADVAVTVTALLQEVSA